MFRFFHAFFGLANVVTALTSLATGEYAGAAVCGGLGLWLGYQQLHWYA